MNNALTELHLSFEEFDAQVQQDPIKIYYMRDNHTFLPLPLDVGKAMSVLQGDFALGETYGMLCANANELGVAHAKADWKEFEGPAREWIQKAVALSQSAPVVQQAPVWTQERIDTIHAKADELGKKFGAPRVEDEILRPLASQNPASEKGGA